MARCSERLLAACALLLAACAGSALPVRLENPHMFPRTPVRFVDYRESSCGQYCETRCQSQDCPFNVATFETESFAVHPRTGRNESSQLTSVMSTIGHPSVTLGRCSAPSRCSLSLANTARAGNFWVKVAQNQENHEIAIADRSGTYPIDMSLLEFAEGEDQSGVFAMGVQLEELIEYEDFTRSGVYDPRSTQVLSRIALGRQEWRKGNFDLLTVPAIDEQGEPTLVRSYNITNKDGKISLRFEKSTFPDSPPSHETFRSLSEPQLRVPTAVRLVLAVQDFAYSSPTSRLGVKLSIITSQENAAIELQGRNVLVVDTQTSAVNAFVAWTPTCLASAGNGPASDDGLLPQPVKPTPFVPALEPSELGYSLARSVKSESGAVHAKHTYFTFAGNAYSPSLVLWDMSVGMGMPPRRQVLVYWETLLAVVVGVLAAALCVVHLVMQRRVARKGAISVQSASMRAQAG